MGGGGHHGFGRADRFMPGRVTSGCCLHRVWSVGPGTGESGDRGSGSSTGGGGGHGRRREGIQEIGKEEREGRDDDEEGNDEPWRRNERGLSLDEEEEPRRDSGVGIESHPPPTSNS